MLGLPAGLCLAYYSAGAIGAAFGWRAAFLFACIPGLLFAWLALRIPEPVRGALDAARPSTVTDASVKSPYAAVLKLPTMWWIILSGIFHNFNMYAINAFQTPFLQRFHEMGLQTGQQCLRHFGGRRGRHRPAGGRLACGQGQREAPRRPSAAVGVRHGHRSALHLLRGESAQGRDCRVHVADGHRHHEHVRVLRHGLRRHSRCDRAAPARHGGGHLFLCHVRAWREFRPPRPRHAERSLCPPSNARCRGTPP